MSIFSDVGDWFSSNSGWIKPITQLVSGAGTAYNESRNQQEYLNLLRQQEQQNYDQSKANYDAYAAWAATQGGGGGGDGGAAAAAAASSNDKAKQKAAKKANKKQQEGFKQIQELWDPYVKTGQELLPVMSGAYKNGVGNLDTMNTKFKTPEFQSSLNQGAPSWMIDVPLPDHMKGKKNG